MPCPYMAGYLSKLGISFGNILKTPLKELLKAGPCVNAAKMTVGHIRTHNSKCGKCPYFKFCGGGCRSFGALGGLLKEGKADLTHENLRSCYFFENGWYQKITRTLSDWKNLSEITLD